jgi:hypothetical protein
MPRFVSPPKLRGADESWFTQESFQKPLAFHILHKQHLRLTKDNYKDHELHNEEPREYTLDTEESEPAKQVEYVPPAGQYFFSTLPISQQLRCLRVAYMKRPSPRRGSPHDWSLCRT